MTDMITMSKADFDAALEVARQSGREEVIHQIRRICRLMHDDSQQEVLVMNTGAFENISDRVKN